MRRRPPHLIELSSKQQSTLQDLLRSGGLAQRVARRARVLLAMTQPQTIVRQLAEQVALTPQAIWGICRRYKERGLAALGDAPRSGRPRQFSPLVRVRIEQLSEVGKVLANMVVRAMLPA